jgi:tetratricopeptide (TPR) repeat protein
MNPSKIKSRRRLFLALLTVAPLSMGCSGPGFSMASMNPFAKKDALTAQMPVPGVAPTGVKAKLASVGTGTKNLWSKSTAVFRKDSAEIDVPDPLSLSEMPEKVDPKIYVANGQLWESTGEPKKAAESYTRALAIDPNNEPALANLARLQYREGNYAAAAEQFQKALNQSPNDAQLCNELGLTLHKLGRTDMALTLMQRALTIEPGNSRYANNLASVMHESGNPEGAFQVLVKNNKPAVAHFNMAYLQFKSGNTADAKKHLTETLKAEGTADNDASIVRAIDRSKEMMAQIAALDSQGTANSRIGTVASTTPTSGQPQSPQPAATGNKTAANTAAANIAAAPKSATTTPAPSMSAIGAAPAEAKVASHTTPDSKSPGLFGFGWAGQDATSGTKVQTASAKMPVKSSEAKADSSKVAPAPASEVKPEASKDAASTPSWLKAFDTSKATSDSAEKPRKMTRPTN